MFVQTGTSPGFRQALVNVDPVEYLADLMRTLMLGNIPKPLPVRMIGLVARFAPLAIRAYRRRT